MSRQNYLFTSESVSEGHPDKVCDRISDSIVDLFLAADPYAKVACETLATTNRIVLAGETHSSTTVGHDQIEAAARRCVKEIGYEQDGFHWENAKVDVYLHEQSADIRQGVDRGSDGEEKDAGAGDQGIMFGYACKETQVLMPAPIFYAHEILRTLAKLRHSGEEPKLGPDAKSQLSVAYEDGKPVGVTSIVLSHQHLDPNMSSDDVRAIVEPHIRETLPNGWINGRTEWHVNPTGVFYIGGPDGDCGLTGRKIIVDTYGGAAPHGGGAFSGKDPSKVDRSAAYASRYLAKNVVEAGLAERCTIQLSYAIGVAKPLSIHVEFYGTGKVDEDKLEAALFDLMDLSPAGIRKHLDLRRPIYERTAAYGHFGRQPENDGAFSWEKLDLVEPLKAALT